MEENFYQVATISFQRRKLVTAIHSKSEYTFPLSQISRDETVNERAFHVLQARKCQWQNTCMKSTKKSFISFQHPYDYVSMEVQLAYVPLMRGIDEESFIMKDDPFIIHIYARNCYTNVCSCRIFREFLTPVWVLQCGPCHQLQWSNSCRPLHSAHSSFDMELARLNGAERVLLSGDMEKISYE